MVQKIRKEEALAMEQLKVNDWITFTDISDKNPKQIIKIEDVIPSHQITLETDYDRIKQMALNKKKSEMIEKFVNSKLPTTFISIDGRYDSCDFKGNWKKESLKK